MKPTKLLGNIASIFLCIVSASNVAVVKGREITNKYAVRCISVNAEWKLTPGHCVQFPLCPRLLEFAKRPTKSLDDFKLLKKLTCGFHHDQPNICCPNEDIYYPPARDEYSYESPAFHFPDSENDALTGKLTKHNNWRWRPPSLPVYVHLKGTPVLNNLSFDRRIPKLEECGNLEDDRSTSTRIIGGTKAKPGDFPFMALLFRINTDNDEEEHYCAGTIINQFYVLTAAHCILSIEDTSDQLAFIQVGITDVTERCQHNGQRECQQDRRYEIEDTVVHPKYIYDSSDRLHDIALIRTKKPIEFNERYIRPVCLPFKKAYGISEDDIIRSSPHDFSEDEHGKRNNNGIVVGWGKVSNFGSTNNPHLNSAKLPILTRNECERLYEGQVKISEKQMCAGGVFGIDSCIGDSGGPILLPYNSSGPDSGRFSGKMFQTGIISFGPSICGKGGRPSVYTKVSPYIDWILDSMYL